MISFKKKYKIKSIKGLVIKLLIIKQCFEKLFSLNSSSLVTYKGKSFYISSGYDGIHWDIRECGNSDNKIEFINQKEFKVDNVIIGIIAGFKQRYKFHLGYWYQILCNENYKRILRHFKTIKWVRIINIYIDNILIFAYNIKEVKKYDKINSRNWWQF